MTTQNLTDALPTALALDVGGTATKAALVRSDGCLVHVVRRPTPSAGGARAVTAATIQYIRELLATTQTRLDRLAGIGISIAAFITHDGTVQATAHLGDGWVGYDFGAHLRAAFDAELYYALDVPAPALGEAYYGAGRDCPDFVYITVSTGIGAAIMVGKAFFTGGLGWAGGIGHTIIDPAGSRKCHACGNYGCLETMAAAQGIIAAATEAIAEGRPTLITELCAGDLTQVTPRLIHEAATGGDALAKAVFEQAGYYLGLGLTNLVDVLAPSRIVIGGGIAQAGNLLLGPVRRAVAEKAFPPPVRRVEIVRSQLSDLSGVYGAAAMVFHRIRV